jgi:hypothetical protein
VSSRVLLPIRTTYAVFTESHHHTWGFCDGEVEVHFDSEDTAWVTPCNRLAMTEDVIQMLADELRPRGVKWMRGWGDGGRQGRVITANGPITCEPWSEVYTTGSDNE